jgi:hypothetical protein
MASLRGTRRADVENSPETVQAESWDRRGRVAPRRHRRRLLLVILSLLIIGGI